jgi:CheY-like chemotaxis protein
MAHILMADYDAVTRVLIESRLETEGYDVIVVEGGRAVPARPGIQRCPP